MLSIIHITTGLNKHFSCYMYEVIVAEKQIHFKISMFKLN